MKEEEVKKLLSEEVWKDFNQFMYGKTIKINPDKSIDIYDYDIQLYISKTFGFNSPEVKNSKRFTK